MALETRTDPAARTEEPPRIGARRRTQARPSARSISSAVLLVGLAATGVWSLIALRVNISTLVDSYGNAVVFLARVLPLTFPETGEIVRQVGLTLAIVLLATLLSVALSIPVAVWAAANTARGTTSRMGARVLVVVARAVPDIVLAIVFVRLFGLGVLPGVLAMGLHSIGMVAKLYADAIEQIDEGPREALRATGASRAQQLFSGVFPQVLPAFVAIGLHRFDINLRVSAILGYVGVAGVGMEMSHAFNRLEFGLGIAWALILVALCVLVELLSTALRRALLKDSSAFERHNRHTLAGLARRRFGRATRATGAGGSTGPTGSAPGPAAPPAARRTSPPWSGARVRGYCYGALALAVVVWAFVSSGVAQPNMSGGWESMARTLGQFWPPSTGGITDMLLEALLVTVQIGFGATLIGVVLALPVGSLAARNVAPNGTVHLLCRGFVLAVRGMPELVLAIILVVVIGLGAVAGTLALGIGAVGLLGKLVADSLEEVDPGPEEALRATGASRLQVYFGATLPQAAPAFIGHTLYQLDVNIRSATLLGIVGGGGIGFYLIQATRVREYGTVTFIVLAVLAVVLVVELMAMWLRRMSTGPR